MAWRCDKCGETDKWDGKCACDREAEASEREAELLGHIENLERQVFDLKFSLTQAQKELAESKAGHEMARRTIGQLLDMSTQRKQVTDTTQFRRGKPLPLCTCEDRGPMDPECSVHAEKDKNRE